MIPFAGTTLLCLSAHVDDEVLPGGLISRAQRDGASCLVATFSPAVESLPVGFDKDAILKEYESSVTLLGLRVVWRDDLPVRSLWRHTDEVRERLSIIRREVEPDVVVCPASSDVHQDHRVIYNEALHIFRNCRLVLGWESPNNERGSFDARIFVELSPFDVARKRDAWRCYRSQRARSYYDAEVIDAMATVRGAQCRAESTFAEAYELISMTI